MSSLAQKREMLVTLKRQLQFREKHIKAEIKKVESQIAEITAAEVSYASEMKQAKRARAIFLPLLNQQEAVKFRYFLPAKNRHATTLNGALGTIVAARRLKADVKFGDKMFEVKFHEIIPADCEQEPLPNDEAATQESELENES